MGKKKKKDLVDIELPEEKEYPIDCYANRELSWLNFNARVLEEAIDPNNPLCEQLNFINIFQSNLDEFFMVRIGTLYDERKSKVRDNKSRMTSREQLDAVLALVRKMLKTKDKCYNLLMSELKTNNVEVLHYDELSSKEKRFVDKHFVNQVMPLLAPQIVSAKQPFPFLTSEDIYTVVLLEKKTSRPKAKVSGKNCVLGIIPSSGGVLRRLIQVTPGTRRYILVEEMIRAFAPVIFDKYRVVSSSLIRLIRNADISIDDDQQDDLDKKSKDYRKAVERMVATRKRMGAIKLEYTGEIDANLNSMLCDYLKLPKKHAFYSEAPLDLTFLRTISDSLSGKKELFYKPRMPQLTPDVSEDKSMFDQIRKKDVILSYPYESMRPFLRLLNEAATDPDVVSIKMTLYRVAKTSQVVSALVQAAENGKDVLVLVELRARFDEENNVEQSRELENAGCHVIYGIDDYKVHSKLCLITRKNGENIEYFTQIGSGNYNEKTARLYTDYSLMTADYSIGEEAATVFTALAAGEFVEHTETLLVAPNCLQNKIADKIDRQIALAQAGKPAYLGFKLNSLTDKLLIDKLIEASSAGVKIQLLIRGISCLVVGVPGHTDNIEIYSIVGRYLEHSRVYIFGCDGDEEVYIASADLMTRNTTRRVEVAAPLLDPDVRSRVLNEFSLMLKDNCKLRTQLDDGAYIKFPTEEEPFNAQEYFAELSYRRAGISLPEELAEKKKEDQPSKKAEPENKTEKKATASKNADVKKSAEAEKMEKAAETVTTSQADDVPKTGKKTKKKY